MYRHGESVDLRQALRNDLNSRVSKQEEQQRKHQGVECLLCNRHERMES